MVEDNSPFSIAFCLSGAGTPEKRYFVLGPFADGLSYTKLRSEATLAQERAEQDASRRRAIQMQKGEKQLDPFTALLAERLRARLLTVPAVQRDDALAHLNSPHLRMQEVAAACEASGILLSALTE
jgi:hypothetical protein